MLQRMVDARDGSPPSRPPAAEAELKRRIFPGGTLRRGEAVYARTEYRPYRDLALREARRHGIELTGDYRLIVFIDAGLQRNLVPPTLRRLGRAPGRRHLHAAVRRGTRSVAGSCAYTGAWNRATDIKRSIGSTGKLFPLIGVHEAGVKFL